MLVSCLPAVLAAVSALWSPLCLIPEPRDVQVQPGRFGFEPRTRILLGSTDSSDDRFAAEQLADETRREWGLRPAADSLRTGHPAAGCVLLLRPTASEAAHAFCEHADALPDPALGDEGYLLRVDRDRVLVAANAEAGLFYGVQTLKQLIRANSEGRAIPCVRIRDYPGMRYRGILDDITRGPTPTLDFLKREVRTLAEFKMNLWTPYIEHQFEFRRHPLIAPEGGSLTAQEVRELTAYARRYHVEIVGCLQSFAHFANILKHPQYAHLGETDGGWILRPVSEDSYRLLGDLYSEITPAFESPLFNVCCDETQGLGEGKSKALLEAFGIEWLYATHINRIHDMLARRGKRMMMWADIALSHPGILDRIPRDTVMLSWGYHAAETFEPAIVPIAQRGFAFMVCPGVNCWGRMFPDIDTSLVNIAHYARDGAKHGALGMINTCWDDDGENLFSVNWYSLVFGGDCAWNPGQASAERFAGRYSQCFYGTHDDSAALANLALSAAQRHPLSTGMWNRVYWADPTAPSPTTRDREHQWLADLQQRAQSVLRQTGAARASATANADNLAYLEMTALKLSTLAGRRLAFLQAADLYAEAANAASADAAVPRLMTARRLLVAALADIRTIGDRYARLWLAEARPYWLDVQTPKYAAMGRLIKDRVDRLDAAAAGLRDGRPLPPAAEVGLAIAFPAERGVRPTVSDQPLPAGSNDWFDPAWHYRIGVRIEARSLPRTDLPVEIELDLAPRLPGHTLDPGSIRVVSCDASGHHEHEIPSQLMTDGLRVPHIAFIAAGRIETGQSRHFRIYFDTVANGSKTHPTYPGVSLSRADGGYAIANERVRWLVLPEGAHVYEWHVNALGGVDITDPGRAGYSGFLDVNTSRTASFALTPLAEGPVVARLRCESPDGAEKVLSFYAGAGWVEADISPETTYCWNFDPATLMASDSPTPGTARFSTGYSAPVGRSGVLGQVRAAGAVWGCKYRPDGLTLGMVTPGRPTTHVIGPGGGWGGAGIEGGAGASHFVAVGDVLLDPPAVLSSLAATLDYTNPPAITLGRVEQKPEDAASGGRAARAVPFAAPVRCDAARCRCERAGGSGRIQRCCGLAGSPCA